jgi:hypothetical protein
MLLPSEKKRAVNVIALRKKELSMLSVGFLSKKCYQLVAVIKPACLCSGKQSAGQVKKSSIQSFFRKEEKCKRLELDAVKFSCLLSNQLSE